ncbi:hypothetical protein [Neobacillus drentensis]|uniref:hypothetical protein n=1 Tax=Neobacillus drentensis TaxID=220684 RepID=UPI0028552A88|nr:hypothetical protein [Neobacillus drentensis]MDR7240679.1 hypothetical protein [Neobacillus drentensis]
MKKVKTKRANVITYTRPSVKSIPANQYERPGHEHIVYNCVKGWFEIRRVGKDNLKTVEFIRREDIRYSMEYMLIVLKDNAGSFKRIRPLTIKLLRKAIKLGIHQILSIKSIFFTKLSFKARKNKDRLSR